jgi:hypothetical protein
MMRKQEREFKKECSGMMGKKQDESERMRKEE